MRPVAALAVLALLATALMGRACIRQPPADPGGGAPAAPGPGPGAGGPQGPAAPAAGGPAAPADPQSPAATAPAPPPSAGEGPDWAPAEAWPQPAAAPEPARRVGGSGAWGLWEDSHGLIAGPLESPGNVWAHPHPQGRYLALWALVDGRNRAFLLDLQVRTLRELPPPEQEGVAFFLLGWLGDGRLAWLAHDYRDPRAVYLVAETLSGEREMIYRGPEVRIRTLEGPSPVASDAGGELVMLQAGKAEPLLSGHRLRYPWPDESAQAMPVGAGGRWLVVAGAQDGPDSLRLFDRENGDLHPLAPAGGRITEAAFSPDGTRLAMVTDYSRLHLLEVATRTVTSLPAEGRQLGLVRWLDDRTVAVAAGAGSGFPAHWVVDVEAGTARLLPAPDAPVGVGPNGWLLLNGPRLNGREVVAIRTRQGGMGVMEEEASVTRLPAAGPPERLARRGSADLLGGQALAVIDDPPLSGIYRLGTGGSLEPLSGPLRPGARPVAVAGGHLAYVYLGYEAWYLRIRPLEPLAPAAALSRADLQGPLPDVPPAPPLPEPPHYRARPPLWAGDPAPDTPRLAVAEGALGRLAQDWVLVGPEVLLRYEGPPLAELTLYEQLWVPTDTEPQPLGPARPLDGGWAYRLRAGPQYHHKVWGVGKDAAGGEVRTAEVYLHRPGDAPGFRRLAAGISSGPLPLDGVADNGHILALATSDQELAELWEWARRIGGAPAAPPAVRWGAEVVAAIVRRDGAGPVRIWQAQGQNVWVEYPPPGSRWSYDIVALPREPAGWEYATYLFLADPYSYPALIGGVGAVLPPHREGPAQGEERARAYAEAVRTLWEYMYARWPEDDPGRAASLLAARVHRAGVPPELALPFPPGRVEVLYMAAAPRTPEDGALSVEMVADVHTGGARLPWPWHEGLNRHVFTLVPEDGGWRLLNGHY